jgi:hypothetical protein
MAAFSSDLAPWIVLFIVAGVALFAVRQIYLPLSRIASSLEEIKTSLIKRS